MTAVVFQSINEAGESPLSESSPPMATLINPQSPPSMPVLEQRTARSVTIRWTSPELEPTTVAPITCYEVGQA